MDALWTVRPAARADTAAVADLERRCFSDPWSEAAIADSLASPGLLALVAEGSTGVEGYVIARVVAGESEILNLAVAPESRQKGVGGRLLDAMLQHLMQRGILEVFLEVRNSNAPARRLYEARGFRTLGRRANYYRRPVEDAIVLHRSLATPA